MREQFAFELTGLTDAERDVVTTAVSEDGYVVGPDETVPDAVRSLVERFRAHESPHSLADGDNDGGGSVYLVDYDDEVYWSRTYVRAPTPSSEMPTE